MTSRTNKQHPRRNDAATVSLPDELDLERALDTAQTAALLAMSSITLAQWRAAGKGPRFFRASARAVRYRLGDVLAFRDARMVGKVQP